MNVNASARRLRTPEERVGMLPNASLPPPPASAVSPSAPTHRGPCGDERLLHALRDRDEVAFTRCVDELYGPMLRVARDHVGDEASAEEVVQETWLAALAGVGAFEGRASVKTWLFNILRNIARRRGRRDARMQPLSEIGAPPADGGGTDATDTVGTIVAPGAGPGRVALWGAASDPERDLLMGELRSRIDAAIAALPPRQREVLLLRDVDGWSAADVCNILGVSDTNQRVLLHRARDRVRNELRDYLGSDEHGDCVS